MPAVRKQPFHSSCRLIRRSHWWVDLTHKQTESLTWTFSHVYISGFPSLHWKPHVININREIQVWLGRHDGIIEVRQRHTQGRYQRHRVTSDGFTTPRWVRDELGLNEAPPQKAGSRLSLHTHQPGRPTNVLILIYSYITWNSRSACMRDLPRSLCEPEVPRDLDCKYSVSPLALLCMRPDFVLRHWVRA